MIIETKRISELIPSPYNPRKMPKRELDKLIKSIEEFGYVEPIVWNKQSGRIIGGHQRIIALSTMGVEEAEVVVVDMDDNKEKLLNIALNRIHGDWDEDKLTEVLAGLDKAGANLELTGFDLNEIIGLLGEKELIEPEIPEDAPTVVKTGDIWQLGRHRLMCGDSTKKEDIDTLMDKKKADMVFTDPPYRLSSKTFGSKGDRQYGDLDSSNVFEYDNWLKNVNEVKADNFRILVWENWTNTKDLWLALEKYFKVRGMIIWNATNRHNQFKNPNTGLYNQYDICLQASYGNKKPNQTPPSIVPFDLISETVERISRSGQDKVFGTKPISILIPYIYVYSNPKDIIVDLFGGSGSTIIACEQIDRICYTMEVYPRYADVIIKRWEILTNGKAVKL